MYDEKVIRASQDRREIPQDFKVFNFKQDKDPLSEIFYKCYPYGGHTNAQQSLLDIIWEKAKACEQQLRTDLGPKKLDHCQKAIRAFVDARRCNH